MTKQVEELVEFMERVVRANAKDLGIRHLSVRVKPASPDELESEICIPASEPKTRVDRLVHALSVTHGGWVRTTTSGAGETIITWRIRKNVC